MLCLVFFVILTGCSPNLKGQVDSPRDPLRRTKASVISLIHQEMSRYHISGLSLAVVDDQRIIWSQGFGYSDVAKGVPASPETVYPAGSIAKLFTVTAALQLAERKKIDLDEPLQVYLPDFSVKSRFQNEGPVTVRSIMTHHSGLPSDNLKEIISRKPSPLTEVLKDLKEEWVGYPPNFIFSYSNTAIRLLGDLIEKVGEKEFGSYMNESVFRPLGMENTSFVLEPRMRPLLSKGYKKGLESKEILLRPFPVPEGPIYTSVLDLSRFIQMVFANGRAGNEQILEPQTLSEALSPQNSHVPLDLDFQIGLGWFLNEAPIDNGGLVASHGGTLSLFHSQLIILPEQKLGVVVLANSSGALHVVNRIAEETLKFVLEEEKGIPQPKLQKGEQEPVIPWPEALLNDYAGYYATGLKVFTVTSKKGMLYTRLMGRKVQLVLHPSGRFSIQYRLFGIIPIKARELEDYEFSLVPIEGRKVLVLHYRGKKILLGEKIEPTPISEAWMKRLGEYGLVQPDNYLPVIEKAQLHCEDNFLMLEVVVPILGDYGIERLKFAIQPISDKEAVLYGLGRNMGETIQVVSDGGVEKLRYSGCEFTRVPASRKENIRNKQEVEKR